MPEDKKQFYPSMQELLNVANRFENHLNTLVAIQDHILHMSQKDIASKWEKLNTNDTLRIGFNVMSIYVDNSQNSTSIIIQRDGKRGSYEIAAYSQKWIHPLGGNFFTVSGTITGTAYAQFVDTFLPIS